MSRRSAATKKGGSPDSGAKRQWSKTPPPPEPEALSQPLHRDVMTGVIGLPRIARIVVIAVFALAWVLAVTPVIDYIYMTYFFDVSTREIPYIIETVIGVIVFALGWRLTIGFGEEDPAPSRVLLLYLIVCCGVLLLVMALTAYGFLLTSRGR